jgi:DNA-binding GntR family transcriptional regulator
MAHCLGGRVDISHTLSYPRKVSRRRNMGPGTRDLSIREKAYLHIQQQIANGKLAAGSGVSELSLAKELGSSRSPIREAMNQLAAEGLLEQNSGGGMLVAQLKRNDIVELYDLREALEVYSVGKIAGISLPAADKDRLQRLVDKIPELKAELESSGEKALNDAQMQTFLACDFEFHALLMSMTQNSRIQKIISETRFLIRIFSLHRPGHDAPLLESIYQYHQRVLDAVAHGDKQLAMQCLAEHIQASQKEQLQGFDHWRRELSLRRSLPDVFPSLDASHPTLIT